jgi:hypothetical protein
MFDKRPNFFLIVDTKLKDDNSPVLVAHHYLNQVFGSLEITFDTHP